MARRPLWPRRPISAGSIATVSFSVLKTRTWFCSPSESTGSMSRFIVPTRRRRFVDPRCGSRRSPDLIHWGRHECLHGGGGEWETGRVGAGTPPVRVDAGWLEIYHGNRQPTRPGEVGTYATGVLLLDPKNPARVLRRTAASIFEPTADFERHGFVPDVVFPTGIVESGDSYLIYYGAADSCTAVVEFSKGEVLRSLG